MKEKKRKNTKLSEKQLAMVTAGYHNPETEAVDKYLRRLQGRGEERKAEEEWDALRKTGGACGGW